MWPLSLIVVALAAGSAVAYGTDPRWAECEHGLHVILWARRLQWPLVGLTTVGSVALIGMTIAGRRRAWWLIGLTPVLALLAHRFAGGRAEELGVADGPAFVRADQVDFVRDDDWVVTLRFADQAYAYPFAALFPEPVVVQTDHDDRMVLIWNAYANRVVAFRATAELKGRDLEVVSTPANAVLVYNARNGQYICGVTGLTPGREKPAGLGAAMPAGKTTYAAWRSANPDGMVMKPSGRLAWRGPTPGVPILPAYAAHGMSRADEPPASGPATRDAAAPDAAARRRVTLVGATKPVAVDVASLSARPNAVRADDQPVVLLRWEGGPGPGVRAFVRQVDDMVLRLMPMTDPKHADVRMRDVETDCLWSSAGVAVGGNVLFRGRRLPPLPVDEDVDYAVMKWWVPDLEVYAEPVPVVSAAKPRVSEPATKPARKQKQKKSKGHATRPAGTVRPRP